MLRYFATSACGPQVSFELQQAMSREPRELLVSHIVQSIGSRDELSLPCMRSQKSLPVR